MVFDACWVVLHMRNCYLTISDVVLLKLQSMMAMMTFMGIQWKKQTSVYLPEQVCHSLCCLLVWLQMFIFSAGSFQRSMPKLSIAESQFLFDRNRSQQNLSSFFGEESIIEEEEEQKTDTLQDSSNFIRPKLSPEKEGDCLSSCRKFSFSLCSSLAGIRRHPNSPLFRNWVWEKTFFLLFSDAELLSGGTEKHTRRFHTGTCDDWGCDSTRLRLRKVSEYHSKHFR